MIDQKPQNFDKSQQLVSSSLMNAGVDQKTQDMINKPQTDPMGVDDTDAEYIQKMMALVDNGTIQVLTPNTLLNHEIYDKLNEEAQGKVDFNAVNLLGEIRQIRKLWEAGDHDSYQLINLLQRMRQTKRRVEEEHGDCYII